MGRGGAGGGGSRGSSCGGSRGSSGRISGSSSSRGGYSSRPSSFGSRSTYTPSRPTYTPPRPMYTPPRPAPPPPRVNVNLGGGYSAPRVDVNVGGYGYGGTRTVTVHHERSVDSVGVAVVLVVVFLVIALAILLPVMMASGGVTASTVEREPLNKMYVNETGYLTDELGWIGSRTKLESGMKDFYNRTGVQPYLYITDRIDGESKATAQNMEAYAMKLYDQLFTDEAHVLVLFHEAVSTEYSTWCVVGTQAKTVIDSEAQDILLDYIDRYYYSDMEDEEMFSTAFKDAGKRMMTVTKSPWPRVIALVVLAVVMCVGFAWWKAKQERDRAKAAETERILNTPIQKLGGTDPELEDLAKKYQ